MVSERNQIKVKAYQTCQSSILNANKNIDNIGGLKNSHSILKTNLNCKKNAARPQSSMANYRSHRKQIDEDTNHEDK